MLDFPASPALNQVFEGWLWDGVKWTSVGGSVTATGAIISRSLADHFADVVYAKDFGAVFDGSSHPLSATFATLAAAQAVYPFAASLADEIDGVATQAAINFLSARVAAFHNGGAVRLPPGLGRISQPLTISTTNVALHGAEPGYGTITVSPFLSVAATTVLRWTGAPRSAGQGQVNMLTVAPSLSPGRRLSACNVTDLLFDCNQTVGVAGPLISSCNECVFDFATLEPAPIPYAGSVLTAGSQTIQVPTTVGVRVGESIVSAHLPAGCYVASIVDVTHLKASAQASGSATETISIGGEGVRFDVVANLPDVNATQYMEVRFRGQSVLGAVAGPVFMIGGTGVTGSGPGGASFGNTSINWFNDILVWQNNGIGMVIGNSDHNTFRSVSINSVNGFGTAGVPGIVFTGSLDPNNASAYATRFDLFGSQRPVVFQGTETGGFINPLLNPNLIRLNYIVQPGAQTPYPTIGTGVVLQFGSDRDNPALAYSGGTFPVSANYPDGSVVGGNVRGNYAVDLQLARSTASQVATGNASFLGGGFNNTALGTLSAVLGSSDSTASGVGSVVLGGQNNSATGMYAIAAGFAADADLYAHFALSGSPVISGRGAQANIQVLIGNSLGGVLPVRLTADGVAAGAANVCNLTGVSGHQGYALTVLLVAVHASDATNSFVWRQPLGLLRRAGAVSTTTYIVVGTPVSGGSGTFAGAAVTEAADTVNGGYSITFTPPTGTTVVWRICATVEWSRVDGG